MKEGRPGLRTLTCSRAARLAVLSLSTETCSGCRLWKNSSPLGPGPICTHSRQHGRGQGLLLALACGKASGQSRQ